MAKKLTRQQIDNSSAFYKEEEKKANCIAKKKALKNKREQDKSRYQSFNNIKINSSKDIKNIYVDLFKKDPFILDVFYIIINSMNIYNTAVLTPEEIMIVLKGPENIQKKKKYYFNCQITLNRIRNAVKILESYNMIKVAYFDYEYVIYVNFNFAIRSKIKNQNDLPENFPSDFIINRYYKAGSFKTIDSHKVVFDKNLELIRVHPSTFAYYIALIHFMDISNVVNMPLEEMSVIFNVSFTTLETYHNQLQEFGLLKKHRSSTGKIRINSYKINSIFSWIMDFVHLKMMAFYLDIYDLGGVIGFNKHKYNHRKLSRLNNTESIVDYCMEEFRNEQRKQKREEYYATHGTLCCY